MNLLIFTILLSCVAAWPGLFTDKNSCHDFPELGAPQDRSHVTEYGGKPYGHPLMVQLCKPVGPVITEEWCVENCNIVGGLPPVTQTCPLELCLCQEECVCENGDINDPYNPCPICDFSLIGKPLAASQGNITILIDDKETWSFTNDKRHALKIVGPTDMWFLVDVSAGEFLAPHVVTNDEVKIQCQNRRITFRDSASTQEIEWMAPSVGKEVLFQVASANRMGDIKLNSVIGVLSQQ